MKETTRGEKYFEAMQVLSPEEFGKCTWKEQPDKDVWEAYADPESFGRNPKPKLILDKNRLLYQRWSESPARRKRTRSNG